MREGRIFFKGSSKNFSSFCSDLVPFSSAGALSASVSGAELEVAAAQTFEFADEVFCAAEVPALQGVLSAGSTQSASSALVCPRRLQGEVAELGGVGLLKLRGSDAVRRRL